MSGPLTWTVALLFQHEEKSFPHKDQSESVTGLLTALTEGRRSKITVIFIVFAG